ncbi:MAG TPA: glycine--tRNA ligase subunit beta [Terriglobales bacterium]|nr:glycine--tRNA ligase subunit beta [Terriglobales bacterium]
MPDFLLEIGTEEIPARMIDGAREELVKRVSDLLVRERLVDGNGSSPAVEGTSTPRRIAVVARDIAPAQADVSEQVLGPSLRVAFKDGQPTPAAHAFAKKVNVPLNEIEKVSTPKGEYVAATVARKGRNATEILAEALPKEIAGLYWAKNMYWRTGKPERFVRPVRWMVALLGSEIIPVEFGGILAGAESRGHRILSGADVRIERPDNYRETLATARVLDQARREHVVRKALDAATRQIPGARWREDKELLHTVVNLTEFPSVILGNFEREYLTLPEEVLVTVMRDHQKYFAVEDASGKLAPHFLAVLNTDGDPNGIIRHGHERVLRARFNDARFFWNTDQKMPLKQRVEMLKAVTFQKDLGSYYEKAARIAPLAVKIADALEDAGVVVDCTAADEAAWLAKTDLTTELVKEFTELQGVVGGLYAKAQGLSHKIADAIYDQYKPASMEDAVPTTIEGAVLAVADKADTIAGMFGLGNVPSGSKDPFALRRQANGIVKTIAEHNLPLNLSLLFQWAREGYAGSEVERKFAAKQEYVASIETFFRERLEFYLRDVHGFAYDVVNAVLVAGRDDVVDAVERAKAVAAVRNSEDFASISVAFKRMKNILRQARETGKWTEVQQVSASVRVIHESDDPAERELAKQAATTADLVKKLRAEKQYAQALTDISRLRPVVDTFFDKVMVMVEDEQIRSNRLALLQMLVDEFSTIADFSEIVTEK